MGFIVFLIVIYLIFANHKKETERAPLSERFPVFCKNVATGVFGFFFIIIFASMVLSWV
jgi:hypothetical protein